MNVTEHRRLSQSITRLVLFVFVLMANLQGTVNAQDVWEFAPYRVRFWLSISPSLGLSQETQSQIQRQITEYTDIDFGPTWQTDATPTPDVLFGSVLYHLDDLTVDQMLSRELILMIGKTDAAKDAFLVMNPPPPPAEPKKGVKEEPKKMEETMADVEARAASITSIRTFDAAISRIKRIAISPIRHVALQRDMRPYASEERWKSLLNIVQPFDGSNDDLYKKFETGEVIAALVQRSDIDRFKKVARQIPTRFPWQPESLLRENDKIYMVAVEREGESIRLKMRELDAFFRRLGEAETSLVTDVSAVPRQIAHMAKNAFAPIARIEEADFKSSILRVHSAGLVMSDSHPTKIGPGDVLQPLIRRDDLNGNPTVMQSIPFTYIAITEPFDDVRVHGAIFAASRGALTAAKNRRTQRVGIKVNSRHAKSELQLGIQRMPNSVVTGAEVYVRTPGTEELTMVGRTDWRGKLTLDKIELPTIQYDLPKSKSPKPSAGEPKKETASIRSNNTENQQRNSTLVQPFVRPVSYVVPVSEQDPAPESDQESSKPAAPVPPPTAPAEPEQPKGSIRLNVPLYLYYVKNGNTVLARLPIVTGYSENEKADLPDDRRRLEAEAYLKGIQGEVLDLVVRRKILATRIKAKINDKKLDKSKKIEDATRLLDELKRIKSHEKLLEQINKVQEQAISTDQGPVLPGIVKRVKKMAEDTQTVVNEYLSKDTGVADLELELQKLK